MVIEKDLSLFGFDIAEQLGHVEEAEKYSTEVIELVSHPPDVGRQIQTRLEKEILKGKKAILDFRNGIDVELVRRRKFEAECEIESALEGLKKKKDEHLHRFSDESF